MCQAVLFCASVPTAIRAMAEHWALGFQFIFFCHYKFSHLIFTKCFKVTKYPIITKTLSGDLLYEWKRESCTSKGALMSSDSEAMDTAPGTVVCPVHHPGRGSRWSCLWTLRYRSHNCACRSQLPLERSVTVNTNERFSFQCGSTCAAELQKHMRWLALGWDDHVF